MEDKTKEKIEHKKEIHVNSLNKETKDNMASRVVMAVIITAVTIPCMLLGGYFWLAYILFLAIFATFEICRAPQSIEKRYKKFVYFTAYLMMFLSVFYIFVRNTMADYITYIKMYGSPDGFTIDLWNSFRSPALSLSALACSIFLLFLNVFFDKDFTINDAFYLIVMIFVISLGLQSFLYLRFLPYSITQPNINQEGANLLNDPSFKYFKSALLVCYIFLASTMNDVGAYFVGVLFGKHKMLPRISPKKTREGFAGGIVISAIITLAFAFTCDALGAPLLEGYLDLEHWYFTLILSLILPLIGDFGDLLFSSIKREFKIKDFGTILKSHGGILDRFDSILLCGISAALFLMVLTGADISKII